MELKNADDVRDLAISIVNRLVEYGLVKDCTDSDDETEFVFQDAISEAIGQELKIDVDI
jgi:hypothetical protein